MIIVNAIVKIPEKADLTSILNKMDSELSYKF
jgi:hypothetical protein